MFFEEFVEQYPVHRIVAHHVRLSFNIPRNQSWALLNTPMILLSGVNFRKQSLTIDFRRDVSVHVRMDLLVL